MMYISLTKVAHTALSSRLKPGDVVIDATAGNGQDTVFLSNLVGASGKVFAIDVQQVALDETRRFLIGEGYRVNTGQGGQASPKNWELLLGDHQNLATLIDPQFHTQIAAIVFNLGYLPRGQKGICTTGPTTLLALQESLRLLSPTGCISVLAYTGHDGGAAEASAVERYFEQIAATGKFVFSRTPQAPRPGQPIHYFLATP